MAGEGVGIWKHSGQRVAMIDTSVAVRQRDSPSLDESFLLEINHLDSSQLQDRERKQRGQSENAEVSKSYRQIQ